MTGESHVDLVATYFDRNAQSWHDYYQGVNSIVNVVLIDRKNIAVEFLRKRLPPGARVLDAGCGAGITAVELARLGMYVEGVDISANMIALASRNREAEGIGEERCAFRVGNLVEETNLFDCVVALGFIQYQEDERAAMQKLSMLIKPGGLLVISGPMRLKLSNYFGFFERLTAIQRRLSRRPVTPKQNLLRTISVGSYSVGRFRRLLREAGLRMEEYRGHGYVHFPHISPRMSLKAQIRLHRSFTRLARILPIGRFANDLVVIGRKAEDQP